MQTTMQSPGTVMTQENGDPASQFAFSKEHLKRRTATASALTFAGRGASIVIQTATSLILARILVPGETSPERRHSSTRRATSPSAERTKNASPCQSVVQNRRCLAGR